MKWKNNFYKNCNKALNNNFILNFKIAIAAKDIFRVVMEMYVKF